MKRLVDEHQRCVDGFLLPKRESWAKPRRYGAEQFLMRFAHWMIDQGFDFFRLRRRHLETFLSLELMPSTANEKLLNRYVAWLKENGYPEIHLMDPGAIRSTGSVEAIKIKPRLPRRDPLPESAIEFLKVLSTTRTPSTCRGYRFALTKFFMHLDDHEVEAIKRLRRRHIEGWLVMLNTMRYAACTRTNMIINVRAYLRWLKDRGELRKEPDDLIRSSDFPKLPKYLPRPLTPDQDRQLQEKLRSSDNIYDQGLLLLRWTGIRIGDLIHLEFDCVREDLNGNSFLKTPLGKLKKEHLIPLDPDTKNLIETLQKKALSLTPAPPSRLIQDPLGQKVTYSKFAAALREATAQIDAQTIITLHRLRHTYATTLLNAGMSLVGVMNLLGHRDHRMTLRYAEVTQKTVTAEYYRALENIKGAYFTNAHEQNSSGFHPEQTLYDLQAWVKNQEHISEKSRKSLLKRLAHLTQDIKTANKSS